jgi:tetratricopeptide (TPR) repeat protein
VDFKNVLTKDQ